MRTRTHSRTHSHTPTHAHAGGFCQRTCQRCSCAAGTGITCAQLVEPDMRASNGYVHGVSRVLFPPPEFSKAM